MRADGIVEKGVEGAEEELAVRVDFGVRPSSHG
jgi:hypothetical protein